MLKALYPSLVWKKDTGLKEIYLTFDDGPHPEVTAWTLDMLDAYHFKATFFCIGHNVQKFPNTYEEILKRGHRTANHTFNHLRGFKTNNQVYFENIQKCRDLVQSRLYRPPHGELTPAQVNFIKKDYDIVMWSLLAEDWNQKLNWKLKLERLKKLSKPGDIIVFHDSAKAEKNLKLLLEPYLQFMSSEGYKSALF